MFRANARIVQTGGNRVRVADLPMLVLKQQRMTAVQHADSSVGDRRRVMAGLRARASSLYAQQLNVGIP